MNNIAIAARAIAAICGVTSTVPAVADPFTFVSVFGSGTACTRSAPCREPNTAYNVTDYGGVITILDDGVFGRLAIGSNNLTIQGNGPGTIITSTGGYAISVGVGTNVIFRDLTIDSTNHNVPGEVGIDFFGDSLDLENVTIRGQTTGSSAGIKLNSYQFSPSPAVRLRNVSVADSGQGSSVGAGLLIETGAGATYRVDIEDSSFFRNSRGIVVQGNGNIQLTLSDTTVSNSFGHGIQIGNSAGLTKLTIDHSRVVNSVGNGVMLAPTGSARVNTTIIGSAFDSNLIGIRSFPAHPAVSNVSISDTSSSSNAGGVHAAGKSVVGIIRGNVSGNSSYGITAVSPAAIRVGSSMVNANTLGLSGPVSSYGNNQLLGNTTQGSSTPVGSGSVP